MHSLLAFEMQKYFQNLKFIVPLATIMLNRMKKGLFCLFLLLFSAQAKAQEAYSSYGVLKLPGSSHVAALGGDNISNLDDEPGAGWSNPALLSGVSDKSFGLNFMTYNSGSQYMGGSIVKAIGQRHTVAVQMQVLRYGDMDETDEEGNVTGSFSPTDFVGSVGYSYLLSERWAGGANLKMTSQSYDGYTSFAMSVDVGLNYFDEDADFSISAAARNIGTQLIAFREGQSAHLPFTLQLGISKGLTSFPLRFHVTMTDLTHWKSNYYYHPEGEDGPGFGKKLLNHFIVGMDILPTRYLYLSAGYNARRGYELKSAGSSKMAGFTFGGGLTLQKFKCGVSWAKYHVGASSLMFNVAYAI